MESAETVTISADDIVLIDPVRYMTEVRIIPLQTNDICLLGRHLDLRTTDEYLLILSNNTIHTFDTQGRFLSKIERYGRGPAEYITISDFRIEDERITVLDNARNRLVTYDREGSYIEDLQLDGFPRTFAFIDDTLLVAAADYYKPDDLFHYYHRRSRSKIGSSLPLHAQKLNYLHILGQHSFTVQEDRLLYTEALSPRILEIDANTVRCRYCIECPPVS